MTDLRRFLILLTIALVVILTGVFWFFPSNDDFRIENPFWNGLSYINNSGAVRLDSLADLERLPSNSKVVVIPYLKLNDAELHSLRDYVTSGGTLILADDYGYGNTVLDYLGLSARFAGKPLLDPVSNFKDKHLPNIFHLGTSPLTDNVTTLVLNYATGLINIKENEKIARSSSFSFLDTNGNGAWDNGEPNGTITVISYHNLAKGKIILISDPSIFINGMETFEGNRIFLQNMVFLDKTNLFIDQSHLPQSNLSQAKIALERVHSYFLTPQGAFGLVASIIIMIFMPVWTKRDVKELTKK